MGDNIFYLILSISALCCLLPYKKQKFVSSILLVAMMIICGLRAFDVGVDTHRYVQFAESRWDDYRWGPLFVLLKHIADFFPNTGSAFLMLMSILTYLPLLFIIKKYSRYPALSVLMFIIPVGDYFVQSMNIARQSIAIIMVLYAAVMVANKKKRNALFYIILAFFFHPYTFPSVIILFLDKIKLTKTTVYVLLGVSIFIGLIGTLSGIQDVLNLMMMMTADSQSDLISKLGKYGDYDIVSGFSMIGQLSHMLPLAAMCVLGLNKFTLDDVYYKLMLLGCVATNIFVSVIFCERIASTFTIAQILAVPYIYQTSPQRRKILVVLLIILTGMLFLYNLKGNMQLDIWFPYHTIFA